MTDELIALEHRGWQALSTSSAAAVAFYDEILDDDAVMLLPGGLVLTDRRGILESMAVAPWSRYELHDIRRLSLTAESAVVIYRASAVRGEGPSYQAVLSSLYVRRGARWRLAFHQQTPI